MDTNKFVGEKIKAFREEQNLSIADLAEKTGLAVEQIERIENNTDIPSLAPLIKMAKALGTRIGTFLDDQSEDGPVIFRRKEEAKETISFSNNAVNSRRHMHYQSLSRSKANRHMEPFMITIEPTNGEQVDFILSSHEGEEFIIVIEGSIEISYGKKNFILEEGDSIYYDSIVPHHVHSFEGNPAKILAVVYTPL